MSAIGDALKRHEGCNIYGWLEVRRACWPLARLPAHAPVRNLGGHARAAVAHLTAALRWAPLPQHSPATCAGCQVARVSGSIHFAVRPEALFLSMNADEIIQVGPALGGLWRRQAGTSAPAHPAVGCLCWRKRICPCPALPAGAAAAADHAARHGCRREWRLLLPAAPCTCSACSTAPAQRLGLDRRRSCCPLPPPGCSCTPTPTSSMSATSFMSCASAPGSPARCGAAGARGQLAGRRAAPRTCHTLSAELRSAPADAARGPLLGPCRPP